MSDATTNPKPKNAIITGGTVPATKVERTLREVQPKKFSPSSLKIDGQDYEVLTMTAPADWSFADAMRPVAWANVATIVAKDALNTKRDRVGSIIQLHTVDHKFFAELYIKAVVLNDLRSPCGLELVCVGPSIDLKTGTACPINLKTGKAWVDPVIPDAE